MSAERSDTAKTGRFRRILLVVSLGVNLLVIAAVAGAVLSGGPHGKEGRSGKDGSYSRNAIVPYISAFSRDDKRAMRTQMRAALPGRSDMRAQTRADHDAFLALVRAEPFDSAAALAVIERHVARSGEVQAVGRQLAIERISQMSQDERAAYAARFEERALRKRHGGPRSDEEQQTDR